MRVLPPAMRQAQRVQFTPLTGLAREVFYDYLFRSTLILLRDHP